MYDRAELAKCIHELVMKDPRKSLKALCEVLMIDRHTAQRALQQSLGMSFRELQLKAVLYRAVQSLTELPSLSLKEVAFRVGFASEATFYHFFKRSLGMTPSEYRRRNGSVPADLKREP